MFRHRRTAQDEFCCLLALERYGEHCNETIRRAMFAERWCAICTWLDVALVLDGCSDADEQLGIALARCLTLRGKKRRCCLLALELYRELRNETTRRVCLRKDIMLSVCGQVLHLRLMDFSDIDEQLGIALARCLTL